MSTVALIVNYKSKKKITIKRTNKLKLDFVINLADAAAFDFMPDILSNCWIFFLNQFFLHI